MEPSSCNRMSSGGRSNWKTPIQAGSERCWIMAMSVLLLLGSAAGHAQTRTASAVAYCRSINLDPASASFSGLFLEAYFTTYDGRSTLPLHDLVGNFWFVSGELSPKVGSAGVYQTDYGLFADSNLDSYGTIELNFPTTDNDGNGIADFLQMENPGNVAFTGNITRQAPTPQGSTVTGQITRSAGSAQGSYSATVTELGQRINYSGRSYLLNGKGSVSYTRTPTSDRATIALAVTDDNGATTNYEVTSDFSVSSADAVAFPELRWTGANNRIITSKPFTLNRVGAKYRGAIELVDGGVSSWRDYILWVLQFTDLNDQDSDGIPDLTDSIMIAPSITSQPQGRTVFAGESLAFSVAASGTAPFTYQWRKNGVPIAGATAPSYALGNVQTIDAGTYTVVIGNGGGNITSVL